MKISQLSSPNNINCTAFRNIEHGFNSFVTDLSVIRYKPMQLYHLVHHYDEQHLHLGFSLDEYSGVRVHSNKFELGFAQSSRIKTKRRRRRWTTTLF